MTADDRLRHLLTLLADPSLGSIAAAHLAIEAARLAHEGAACAPERVRDAAEVWSRAISGADRLATPPEFVGKPAQYVGDLSCWALAHTLVMPRHLVYGFPAGFWLATMTHRYPAVIKMNGGLLRRMKAATIGEEST